MQGVQRRGHPRYSDAARTRQPSARATRPPPSPGSPRIGFWGWRHLAGGRSRASMNHEVGLAGADPHTGSRQLGVLGRGQPRPGLSSPVAPHVDRLFADHEVDRYIPDPQPVSITSTTRRRNSFEYSAHAVLLRTAALFSRNAALGKSGHAGAEPLFSGLFVNAQK
jgi:hypothetical protein